MTASGRPNIVWLFPDQWRHDALGAAGNTTIRTPHLDELARRGAVFRQAHCESPVCMPSRASLLTGTYPSEHGLLDNAWFPDAGAPLSPEAPNFVRTLRGAGYRTAEVGKMHLTATHQADLAAFGFDDHAEELDKHHLGETPTPYTRYLAARGLLAPFLEHVAATIPRLRGAPGPKAGPDAVPADDTLDAFILRSAADYIRGYDRDEPFFLWVAPVGPHPPYDAPAPFSDLYDAARMPRGPRGLDPFPDNAWGRYLASTVAHLGCASWSEDDFGIAAKHYYASISLIDHGLGWILDALRSSGREESTWLLVSSDHGDLLGDHGFYAKRVFYDGAVRIPQIVVPPPGEGGGIATDALTQGFDLPATILDLAGARPDPSFRGRSLLPALSGESVGRAVVYSEIDRFLLVTTAQHKLVVDRSTGEPQAVYDRRGDPDERENLLGTSRGRAIVVALADHVAAFPGSEPSR